MKLIDFEQEANKKSICDYTRRRWSEDGLRILLLIVLVVNSAVTPKRVRKGYHVLEEHSDLGSSTLLNGQ